MFLKKEKRKKKERKKERKKESRLLEWVMLLGSPKYLKKAKIPFEI
jgi:hypothetical protein